MSDKELIEYMNKIDPNFNSHLEKGTIEMSNEYYDLLEERMARLINKNQELKSQIEELKLQNFNLREDIMIKKISFPSKKIKDKTFFDLYDMPTYEELKKQLSIKTLQLEEMKLSKRDYTQENILEMKLTLKENQQKEFIEYMEYKINKIKEEIKTYDIWHEVEDINFLILKKQFFMEDLSKYKSIIGVSNDKVD